MGRVRLAVILTSLACAAACNLKLGLPPLEATPVDAGARASAPPLGEDTPPGTSDDAGAASTGASAYVHFRTSSLTRKHPGPCSVTDHDPFYGGTTTYEYDARGRVIVSQGRDYRFTYEFAPDDSYKRERFFLSGGSPKGISTWRFESGRLARYERDYLTTSVADGVLDDVITYHYDAQGNLAELRHIDPRVDGSAKLTATTTFTRDEAQRTVRVQEAPTEPDTSGRGVTPYSATVTWQGTGDARPVIAHPVDDFAYAGSADATLRVSIKESATRVFEYERGLRVRQAIEGSDRSNAYAYDQHGNHVESAILFQHMLQNGKPYRVTTYDYGCRPK